MATFSITKTINGQSEKSFGDIYAINFDEAKKYFLEQMTSDMQEVGDGEYNDNGSPCYYNDDCRGVWFCDDNKIYRLKKY